MCLLFTQTTADRKAKLTDEQLADMYRANKDGYGVMYSKDGKLHIDKGIGTVDDWIKFYRRHEDLDAAFHLRMRTHGAIDLTNCHPYDIYGFEEGQEYQIPLALMHNGVLQTGNTKDTSKSDTWHYIRDYLRPILDKSPEIIFEPAFQRMVGSHIGASNKFCVVDHSGRMAVINRSSGIEWNGMWFSNTYAWSANDGELYPGRPIYNNPYYGGRTSFGGKKSSTNPLEMGAGKSTKTTGRRSGQHGANGKKTRLERIQAINDRNAATLAYVNAILDEDLRIGHHIPAEKRAAIVRRFTVDQIELLMEEAFMGGIDSPTLVRMFDDPSCIYNWLLGEKLSASIGKDFVASQDEAEEVIEVTAKEVKDDGELFDDAAVEGAIKAYMDRQSQLVLVQ